MKSVKKIAGTLLFALISILLLQMVSMAASHDQDNPTVLPINTKYESNAGYGDEYYTFDIDTPSHVCITVCPVPINHSYTLTLIGGNDMIPIEYKGTEETDIEINTDLRVGTYYMTLSSSLDDWSDVTPMTEPDAAWYPTKIITVNCFIISH